MQMVRHMVNGVHYAIYILISGILHLWEESSKILSSPTFSKKYRNLQILEGVLNRAVRGKILPLVLVACPGIQILSAVAFIKFQHVMPGTHLVFLGLAAIDGLIMNILFCTAAGVIFRTSGAYLRDMKGVVKDKVGMRLLKSFAPLKVRFGSNFMDELTPLVIQQFCSIQTMNMLLLL